ncbi:MAG: MarR family transcriptional regulator [Chitinophagaceae bacterium]|nr:MarR family transcriptional regulator [Chitinophagaceae bacterium]
MTTRIKNEDTLNLLTGRTPLNINRLLSYFLKESDISLTKEQWSVMAVLWKNDGCTQQVIADATYRDRPGTTRLLDNLEKDGFIERRADKTDRRANLIYLTKKGKSVEKSVVEALDKTINVATKGINDQKINLLREIFEQINTNIQEAVVNK